MKDMLRIFLFLPAVAILLMTTGCATVRIDDLKKDSLQGDADFKSIVYWNVNIRDFTGKKMFYPAFYAQWYDEGSHEYKNLEEGNAWVAWGFLNTGQSKLDRSTKDGVPIIQGTVIKKAKPGKYRIDHIQAGWEGKSSDAGKLFSLDIYVDKEFTVTPGAAHYLGSFDLDILKEVNGQFSYNFKINQNENDLRASYVVFGSRFPNLAAQFQNNVLLTYLVSSSPARNYSRPVFAENFAGNAGGWEISRGQYYDMFFENGRYIVETKNEKFSRSLVKIQLPYRDIYTLFKSPNCDVELVSSWQSGREDMPFGLIAGSGASKDGRVLPYYFFAVSKDGKAAVYENKTGNYTLVMPWVDVKSLQGAKEISQKVELSPDGSVYFVNGEFVGRVQTLIPEMNKTQEIGVVVAGQQKVAFKQLKVTGN